jgi:hypothetical protein
VEKEAHPFQVTPPKAVAEVGPHDTTWLQLQSTMHFDGLDTAP